MQLKGKTVLVTGSSSGIGRAIAIACAHKGSRIVIHYRKNRAGAEETAHLLGSHVESQIVQADLTVESEINRLFSEISGVTGLIDILVNNAGEPRPGNFLDREVWHEQFQNIFFSALYVSQKFLSQNASADLRKIINIGSYYGNSGGVPEYPAYSVAKAALSGMTIALAKTDGRLLVNAISPGYTWTPPWENISDKERRIRESRTMIGRFITPEEIAHLALAILENDAITGQVITIDGGLSLQRFSAHNA